MKVQTIGGRDYQLPNELNDFQIGMYVHLINWKWKNVTTDAGFHKHKGKLIPYDAILPDHFMREEKTPHLYPAAAANLAEHRRRNAFRNCLQSVDRRQ